MRRATHRRGEAIKLKKRGTLKKIITKTKVKIKNKKNRRTGLLRRSRNMQMSTGDNVESVVERSRLDAPIETLSFGKRMIHS